ncbi:MAG: pre-peptidase C-terminal domain-containing protein, partial [Gammaproteobacteria bacterium]
MNRFLIKAAAVTAMLGLAAGTALADTDGMATNPYAPSYGHHYRHGAIPSRDAWAHMKQWRASHNSTRASSNTLYYRGGTNSSNQGNVGVLNGHVKVYLVFYGSGWGTQSTNGNGDAVFSGDPDGAAQAAQEMFKGIGMGGETWSADLTQWCQGISSGSSSCPANTPASSFVPYQSGGVLAGVWEDTSHSSPINATAAQLGQEAVAAAAHFGNTTAASNRYAYYIIMSAHGDNPDNYQSPTQGYCAWHDWNGDVGVSSSHGDIAFSNQPYNMDLGASCGVGFVNSPGTLDGWTMTLGHEWHETLSDQFPAGGWTANSGYENSDECAWKSSGQGASANVTFTTGSFTEQSSWSNDTNECDLSHAILDHGGGNSTPVASNGSVSTNQDMAVNGTLSASDTDGD